MKILNSTIEVHNFFEKVSLHPSLLLLDYDGTLAPFVKDRLKAHPYPQVQDYLEALIKLKNVRVVIVSGRSLVDLKTVLQRPLNLEMWGSHGLERHLPDGTIRYIELTPNQREGLNKGLKACQDNVSKDQCEIKPFAVAVHWRGTNDHQHSPAIQKIHDLWKEISKSHDLELHQFDNGVELRLKGRNKGDVIKVLLKEVEKNTAIAYLGDDNTDEDAFQVLGNRGLKVLVKKDLRPTLADIAISPPDELLAFLKTWIKSASKYLTGSYAKPN